MSPTEITQEATKLINPFYFWSTVTACVPDQIIKALSNLGVTIETDDQLIDEMQNLVETQNIPVLTQIAQQIEFNYDNMPENYDQVILKFKELSKKYTS